jgi:hypothetical protein
MSNSSISSHEGKPPQELLQQKLLSENAGVRAEGGPSSGAVQYAGRSYKAISPTARQFTYLQRAYHIAWGAFLLFGSFGTALLFSPSRKYVLQQFAKAPVELPTKQKVLVAEGSVNDPQGVVGDIVAGLPLEPFAEEKITEFFQKMRHVLGKERYERTCTRMEQEYGEIRPTEKDLRTFLLLLFDIQKIDIDEQAGKDPVAAYKELIPFESMEQFKKIFLRPCPNSEEFYIDKVKTSGKGLKGLEERVFLNVLHHFHVQTEGKSERAFLRDAEMLTGRYIDREPPQGSLIHLKEGVFFVDKTFSSSGGYVSVLRDIKGERVPKLVCRGTAVRRTATSGFASGINDLLPQMGMWGVQAIWPELSKYLKDEQSVEIFGKSLGGAVAQELTVLLEGKANVRVDHLVTVCSVGVGKEINDLFLNKVLAKREGAPLAISVLRNKGNDDADELDYVPILGGKHIGVDAPSDKCKSLVYELSPQEATISPISKKARVVFYMRKLSKSLGACHCRQTTLKDDFKYQCIEDPTEVNELLLSGEIFERIRRSVTFIFKQITLHRFSYRLEDYFKEKS